MCGPPSAVRWRRRQIAAGRVADLDKRYDVLVVGGGNAGLCAAITARRAGASVLVLEAALVDAAA